MRDEGKDIQDLRAKQAADHAENRELRRALEEMRALLVAKDAEIAGKDATNAENEAEIARLKNEIQVLQERLERRNRALYGRKSERHPTAETANPPQEEEASGGPPEEAPPKKRRRRGHGRTPQPALPVDEVKSTLTEEARQCPKCGGHLEEMGKAVVEAELIALERRKVVLERHLLQKYCCPGCQQSVVTAPGPVRLIPGGRYALSFTVEVAYQKYALHMPLERQAKVFGHEKLVVGTAALWDQIDALATALTPTYQAIWARLQAEPVLHADETPWAVLSNGHTANEKFWAWAAVGRDYVGFKLLDTRSKDGAKEVLGDFSGTLIVDGLTSYPAAAAGAPGAGAKFKVANCHAHSRRYFVDCLPHYPKEAGQALKWYEELYQVEREGKEPGADLIQLRSERSRPLIDQLFTWAQEQLKMPGILPRGGLAKALNYLINHEAALRIYLDDQDVAIDNNLAERSLRGLVLGRKNHLCSRSRRGTEAAAVLYTLIESAQRCGIDPRAYLEAAAEHALRRAGAVLFPDEFRRQLEEADSPKAGTATG